MAQTLAWYWNRLLAMSPSEILARIEATLKKRIWRRRVSWVAPTPNLIQIDPWKAPSLIPTATVEREDLLSEANRYLEGRYSLLNIPSQEDSIDWHLDPQTGNRSPLEFGLDLDYRDISLVGNVKNIWEKNRHHHLTVLALAYALTKDQRYAQAVVEQLSSWVRNNPFPLGINWASPLEWGIRLISWVWIERLLRGTDAHTCLFGEDGILWPAIYWHQWFLAQNYSQGSSANNHLIGELAGLFISASLWPVFPESARWQTLARTILEEEVIQQTFPSGINRELGFSYHLFVLEFCLLAGLEAERLAVPFSLAYQHQVRQMLVAIPPLVDVGGNLPRFGDSDDGMAVQLRPLLSSSRLNWLFHLGRQWLGARIPQPVGESGFLAATFIGTGIGVKDPVGDINPPQSSIELHDAGLFVLSARRGQPDEIFCLADAGPLGYLSTAAHGHADALSFTLSIGGTPIIVDPGTFTYHAEPQWRNYFRGTKAHNTVTVDGVDQSEPSGIFLWGKKANSKVLSWQETPEGGVLLAEHDGYTRLSGKVVHRRQLNLNRHYLEITDKLLGSGMHTVEWRLHFSPACKVSLSQNLCQVSWQAGQLEIGLDNQMEWRLSRGEAEAGWYSSGFNLKETSYTLSGLAESHLPMFIKNSIQFT